MNIKLNLKAFISVLLLCLLTNNAMSEPGDISIDGFLTFSGSYIDTDEDRFLFHHEDYSLDNSSMAALQGRIELSESLSATAQVIAHTYLDHDPSVEWAFLTYQATDELKFRAGKLRAPFFSFSDYLEVGYAYPWIRPPSEVYDNIPFSSVEGINATYSHPLGDWSIIWETYYGNFDDDVTVYNTTGFTKPVKTKADNLKGLALNANYDWLTLRAGYHKTKLDFDTLASSWAEELDTNLRAFGFNQTADDMLVKNNSTSFMQFGGQIDYEDWLLIAEWTHLDFDTSSLSDTDAWYTTIGRRFGDFTLHYTYSKAESDTREGMANRLLPFLPVTAELVSGTERLIRASEYDRHTHAAGVRWDIEPGKALKFELQKSHNDRDADAGGGVSTSIISVAFDMVF